MIFSRVLFVLLGTWLTASPALAQLNSTEKRLVEFVDTHNDQAVMLLKQVVNINSGTMNFDGVRKVGDVLGERFKALGMRSQWVDGSAFKRAGHLIAKVEGGNGPNILMIGHLDTVFEQDSPNQHWRLIDENTLKGPGVADMKGGDVVILHALAALHESGLLRDMNITVVMTGDEEASGEPLASSKAALVEAAKWADIALGFENADGDPATAIVARRSSSGWKLTVTGKAAHSSQIFKPEVGAGAIFEASRILQKFYSELAAEEYLTFNPGVFLGGTRISHDDAQDKGTAAGKRNVVAKEVTVAGDLRCISAEQLASARAAMRKIVAENLPNTDANISFDDGYPAFAPSKGNRSLLRHFSQVSEDLGFGKVTAVDPNDAGAADISFTSDYVAMGIDGMGMGGADDHTVEETGDLRTLPMQTKRAAVLLYRLAGC